MRHGEGYCSYANRSNFRGTWQHNLPVKGVLTLEDGTMFDGEWKDDMFSGVGIIHYPNSNSYQGEWKENKPHRYGKMVYRNGQTYTGEWRLGQK